jgi:hypothetical protein
VHGGDDTQQQYNWTEKVEKFEELIFKSNKFSLESFVVALRSHFKFSERVFYL